MIYVVFIAMHGDEVTSLNQILLFLTKWKNNNSTSILAPRGQLRKCFMCIRLKGYDDRLILI